jgi:hypothetical protein
MEALADVQRQQQCNWNATSDDDDEEVCLEVDWSGTIDYITSMDAQEEGLQSWLWQTCTEFGYYQPCEKDSLCPFGRGYHDINMDFEICEKAFNVI